MNETKFKQTEVGLIPEDWEVVKFGDIATRLTYGVAAEAKPYDGIHKYIRITDISDKNGTFQPNPLTSPSFYSKEYICKTNDLLIARTGASVGKSYLYKEEDGCLIFAGFLIRVQIKEYNSKFIFYKTQLQHYKEWIVSESMRSGQPGINAQQLKNYMLSVPPLPEQQRIANVLTDIDSLLLSLEHLITKKKAIKEGAMQQLLTGKKRLKGFDEPWVENKIDDLFNLGNGYTPSKNVPAFWTNGSIPWFRMEDIRKNGRILKDSIQHITPEAVKCGKLYPAFSIILSTTATIGEHALLIADSLANQRFTFLNRKVNREDTIDIMYFFHYCFILGKWCKDNINDGGLLAVNMDDLKNHIIKMPESLIEQQAIAQILSDMDSEISALEAKRKKYETIKQGMMQQLLTGKIRLTDPQKENSRV